MLNAEQQAALAGLYARYGNDQTPGQKINILERELGGPVQVSYMGMHRDPPEEHERMKLVVLEADWLENVGLSPFEPT